MKVKSLKLHNFGSFTDEHKEFEDQDLIGIIGRHRDNDRKSVGSGKSTLLESILYVLYGRGRTGKASVESFIKAGSDEMHVELCIDIGGYKNLFVRRETKVTSSGKAKSNMTIKCVGDEKPVAAGVKDCEAFLSKIMPFDYNIFTATSFFVQEKSDAFTSATAGDRKEYVRKIEDSVKIFEKAREVANLKLLKANDKIENFNVRINTLQKYLLDTNIDDFKADKKRVSTDIKTVKVDLDKMMVDQKAYEINKANVDKKQVLCDRRDNLSAKIREYEETIVKSKKDMVVLEEAIKEDTANLKSIDISGFDEEKYKEVAEQHEAIKDKQAKLKAEIDVFVRVTQKEIDKKNVSIEKWKNTDKCTACGSIITDEVRNTNIFDISAEIDVLMKDKPDESELEKIETEYNSLSETLKLLDDMSISHDEAVALCTKLENAIDNNNKSLDVVNESGLMLEDVLGKYRVDFDVVDRGLSEIKVIEDTVDLSDEIKKTNTTLDTLNFTLGKIETTIDTYSKTKGEIKQLEDDIGEDTVMVEVYSKLVAAFGKDGIPNLIIEHTLSDIESVANGILYDILPEMRIKFDTQRETKTGGTVETLDIIVSSGADDRRYETFSGGERTIINFAIRLAISQYLSQNSSHKIELVVLDEVFGALDDVSRAQVISVLQILKKRFKQIFVISHTDIQGCFEHIIEVEKSRSGSVIING